MCQNPLTFLTFYIFSFYFLTRSTTLSQMPWFAPFCPTSTANAWLFSVLPWYNYYRTSCAFHIVSWMQPPSSAISSSSLRITKGLLQDMKRIQSTFRLLLLLPASSFGYFDGFQTRSTAIAASLQVSYIPYVNAMYFWCNAHMQTDTIQAETLFSFFLTNTNNSVDNT